MSSLRMFDLSRSKWIIAARLLRTSSPARASAARESARRWFSMRPRSAAACRSASALAALIESRIRAFSAAVSIAGVVFCGAGLPPHEVATVATLTPSMRSNDTDFILSLRSGVGRWGLRKPWRPSRQTRPALLQQWPNSAGVEIDDPQLAVARPVGNKGEMTAVGRPSRILVAPHRGELPDRACPHVEHEHLQRTGHVPVKRYRLPVGRPLGRIGRPGHAVVEWREQLLVRSIRRHHIDLRQTRARRDECNALPVRAERRGQVV